MKWEVVYLPEAEKDFKSLDGSQKMLVRKAIEKIRQNPLSVGEQGYGKPLGQNLSGFLKVKLRHAGLRIVYKLIRTETSMLIVVIGARADEEVYRIAQKRIQKYSI